MFIGLHMIWCHKQMHARKTEEKEHDHTTRQFVIALINFYLSPAFTTIFGCVWRVIFLKRRVMWPQPQILSMLQLKCFSNGQTVLFFPQTFLTSELAVSVTPKPTIRHSHWLHAATSQLCRGEEVSRVWTCLLKLSLFHWSLVLLPLCTNNAMNSLQERLSDVATFIPVFDEISYPSTWQAFHLTFERGRLKQIWTLFAFRCGWHCRNSVKHNPALKYY